MTARNDGFSPRSTARDAAQRAESPDLEEDSGAFGPDAGESDAERAPAGGEPSDRDRGIPGRSEATHEREPSDRDRGIPGRSEATHEGVSPPVASDAIDAERDELRALAQRVQADFENYRKRVLREQTAVVERATEGLVESLLPVLDSFELALGTLDTADDRVRKGVELVYAELLGVLEKAGLERIETDGVPFDPNVHEAVMHEEGDGEPVVGETMRNGYRLKGRVVRPAMVKVTR